MCHPGAMMVGMAIASAATTIQQQKAAADAAKEQEKMATQHAMQTRALQEQQLAQELKEAQAKAKTDKFDVSREAAVNRGKIMAAASEGGAFGNLTLRELSENMMNEGYDTSLIDYNLRQTSKNADLKRKAHDLNAETTIQANKAPKRNGMLDGLQIGTSALNGAMSGYGMGKSVQGAFSKTKGIK